MAIQQWEQNNFRDGIMTDGMTGRNETELYMRSVYDIVDCMPTPFGSLKNNTIGLDSSIKDGSGNTFSQADQVNWSEVFYGVLKNQSTYGKCTVLFIPYPTQTLFCLIKNGVLVFAAWKAYIMEKGFFQLDSSFYLRVGGNMRIANEWGDLLPIDNSYAFFEVRPQQKSIPFKNVIGTARTVQFYREAGQSIFIVKATPGSYYMNDGVVEINGGKGVLYYQNVSPAEGLYYFRVVNGLFPGDTSRVDTSTGAIVTDWKAWDVNSIYYEYLVPASSLTQATEMIFWNSRLVITGVPGYESRLFISKVALYGDFSNYENNPDEAIQSDIGFRANITHMISYDQLLIFTERNMYYTRFDTQATPTSFSLTVGTDVSSTDDIRPTILNENLVFVNMTKDKIVLLNPNYNTYNYDYINITLQLYGRLGQINFISKSALSTDFLNNHLIIEAEKGRFLLQIDRNENIISYTRIDNKLGIFKHKFVDENNKEWFFITNPDTGWWTVNSIKLAVAERSTIKLHPQRIWFDGRGKKYYDKNVKSTYLKIYYKGDLSFEFMGKELFDETFQTAPRDPNAPKLFVTSHIIFNWDEYVTIINKSGKPWELFSVVVGVI